MSRIPAADWLRIAEDARGDLPFSKKMEAAAARLPKPTAALVALSHEASETIERLAVLIERGSNSVLIDKASAALSRWNQSVREAESQIGGARRS